MPVLIPTGGVVPKLGRKDHELVAARHEVSVTAALADGDFAVLGVLPAGHVLVDAYVDVDDLDTNVGPAIVFSAGVLDDGATPTQIVANKTIMSLLTTAQSGGIGRADEQVIYRFPVALTHTYFGVEITTTAATAAASGKIGMTLIYRRASQVIHVADKVLPGFAGIISPKAGAVVTVRGEVSVHSTLKATDVFKFVKLPVGAKLLSVSLDTDDLDAGSGFTMDIGLLDTAGTGVDSQAVFFSANTLARTGGRARETVVTPARTAPLTAEKVLGGIVKTQGANPVTGKIGVTAMYYST